MLLRRKSDANDGVTGGAYVFANVLLTMAGSAILLLWWAINGVCGFIGVADCGRKRGADQLVLSIMATLTATHEVM
uniref:Uncharacterized protein n=1 Tax=Candidatus Methanogaster sp. ANME-2c ERB4 TaxID=2759911 RepID=A0A7G9Y4E6_9EURY|nr:hypothetical protein FAIOLEIP_00004 [Methanosarcinales archaeon ANME-2c ERB4]QNO50457.1 hypothetical protein BPCBKEJI_00035 [Methanosarcinales archaeon ANME-2c ERB4]